MSSDVREAVLKCGCSVLVGANLGGGELHCHVTDVAKPYCKRGHQSNQKLRIRRSELSDLEASQQRRGPIEP